MYVDKKLDGVKTVQTLSRLNRTYSNKNTFILDFQNSTENIQEAYKPYFETTNINKITDEAQEFFLRNDTCYLVVYYKSNDRNNNVSRTCDNLWI